MDAGNVSQWPPPLPLIYLSPSASTRCKTAHGRPQNFLEVVNLIYAVCAEHGRFLLLWAGTDLDQSDLTPN